ncbi:aspartate/glutamate racemase family protein [Stutzerimonas sp. R40042]|uniref:aspartate/glutamate racemase family protein n=1 Tax=Stutzerimonas sp. R40042 TaxID=2998559 RepID=UPI0022785328|nr:aspartate/glutamate racemase family protein [Stutzerimonas sp. R40042]WAE60019.1 aspartate/glutamate racemase family protein [Stutzerimonas sp. R40042]WCR44048.1 aspartate/glutamate racemase family protein [Stutzerimonas stutzeri]
MDLWAKILKRNKKSIGKSFQGDLDAPRMVVVSEPLLGLSMDLAANEEAVWSAMRQSLNILAPQVDAYAIACNTLNWFAPRIAELNLSAELISFQSVLERWINDSGVTRLALLGAAPVTEMGEWSAYRDLSKLTEVELPESPKDLHVLIEDVKRLGSDDPSLRPRFKQIIDALTSDVLILACTELPLIADIQTEKTLVDVTNLVADALVACSCSGEIVTTPKVGRDVELQV